MCDVSNEHEKISVCRYWYSSFKLSSRPRSEYNHIVHHSVSLLTIFIPSLQPVLVITTGKQTADQGLYTPLDIASSRIQSKGAAVFVLGIGKDVDNSELTEIASSPDNIFAVDSFKDLHRKADEAKRGICILGN